MSFESVYGRLAKEITFEYGLFLETVGNGYRADLAAWPWRDVGRARKLRVGATAQIPRVKAAAGWQAARVHVDRGAKYEIEAQGTWKTAEAGPAVTAAGDAGGRGRLLAAVFRKTDKGDFVLGSEFPIGDGKAFAVPEDGELFMRCSDPWTQLGDNAGEITVTVRRVAAP